MPESDFHFYAKQDLYERLSTHKSCHKCDMERTIGSIRPDVSLYIQGKPVAVELQCSAISPDLITERTMSCSEQGLNVLWIVDRSLLDKRDGRKYSPSAWEKFLHAMYFGRVYYYYQGLDVLPVHFDEHRLWVPAREWYDSEGEDHTAGGYFKRSKMYRSLSVGGPLNIVKDFRATRREEWSGGSLTIPPARLWIDNRKKWW